MFKDAGQVLRNELGQDGVLARQAFQLRVRQVADDPHHMRKVRRTCDRSGDEARPALGEPRHQSCDRHAVGIISLQKWLAAHEVGCDVVQQFGRLRRIG
ncbi:hypothetical protein D3C72_749860 [compost metagenome]